MKIHTKYSWLVAGLALLLTACHPAQVRVASQVELPAQYTFAGLAGQGVVVDTAHWWRTWQDPYLDELITKALHNNLDIKAAQARVLAARALADYARAQLGPMLGATASAGAQTGQIDNNLGTGINQMAASVLSKQLADKFSVNGTHYAYGIAASWDPDIFGGKQSDADAARFLAESTQEMAYASQVVVAGELADHYVQARSLERQLQLLDDTINTVEEMHRYVTGRFQAGQTTRFAVTDVESNLSALKAQRAPLQALRGLHVRQIAVLLGVPPQTFTLEKSAVDVLTHLPPAPQGVLPSDLLLRRPDIRARAAKLWAFSANLASAKTDLLPRFYINFLLQDGHIGLSDLPNMHGWLGLLEAGMQLPIITSGRIHAHIRASQALVDEAARQYDQNILKALAEVDSAMQLRASLNARTGFLNEAIASAKKRTTAAKDLFTHGNKELKDVLDSRLTTLQYQSDWVQTRLNAAQATIKLYQALGGGWQAAEKKVPPRT